MINEDYYTYEYEACPECNTPLKVYTQAHLGGHLEEIAVCGGCGYTESVKK